MLGRILSQHPEVAYWVEPRPVWMFGNAYRAHDELTEADLRPRIARHIDRRFDRFLRESSRSRFAEKTPSNCLRIRFIRALYPDCRIVNIIRDGRNVTRSILQIRKSPPNKGLMSRRLRETVPWEWPAYLPLFFRTAWRTKVLRKPSAYWGPRPKGWKAWLDLPPHLQVAEQWRAVVEITLRDGRALPPENYLELRYEDLMARPIELIGQILDFTELSASEAVTNYTRQHIDPERTHRWQGSLGDDQEREVEAHLSPMLDRLGYLAAKSASPASSEG